jgi:tRNA nucleotidyltransferase/poly(A) polymerase
MKNQKNIDGIISLLRQFAKLYSIDSIFFAGEYCRSLVLKGTEQINYMDVVSAYQNDAIKLCGFFSSEFLHQSPTYYHKTGTAQVTYNGIKIEFQNGSMHRYMHNDDVKEWMRKNRIENTPLINNIYGRDFTINSLVFSIKTGELYDLTKRATEHIEKKIISTILPSEIAIKYNPIIILRAIRFLCQYDFFIAPELRAEMKTNIDKLTKNYSKERITQEIEKILKINTKEGLVQFKKYGLTRFITREQISNYISVKEK